MKALVMELKEGRAAVLTDKGTFEIIEDNGYEPGQRIDVDAVMFESDVTHEDIELELELQQEAEIDTILNESVSDQNDIKQTEYDNGKHSDTQHRRKNVRAFRKTSGMIRRIAAAAAVVVIIGGGAASYAAPVSTISVDVNPSLEIKLNVFDRVVSVRAYDEDDRELAEIIDQSVKGKKLQDALHIALSNLRDNDYITGDDTSVVTSVYTHFGKDDELKKKLETSVEEWNSEQENNKLPGKVELENVDVDEKTREDAAKKNVSPGKLYKAAEVEHAYEEAGEDTDEDWLDKPVDELNNAIKNIKEQPGEQSKEQPSGGKDHDSDHDQEKVKGNGLSTDNSDNPVNTFNNSKDNNGITSGNGTVPDNSSDREAGDMQPNDREGAQPGNTDRKNEDMQAPPDGNSMENGNPPGNDMGQGGGMMP